MTVLFWILTVILAAADQFTKGIAERYIPEGGRVCLLEMGERDILSFSLHQNTGAAFSSFSGKTAALSAVTAVAMAGLLIFFHRIKRKHPLMTVSFAMVVGGGIGNLIDRVGQGYVTDFIHLFPFNFIFNFADICVVIGGILLVIYYLFIDEKFQGASGGGKSVGNGSENDFEIQDDARN
ncbi:MAG: signal peptidase II [Oscillospiraceae bacterium]|nr:signal peptidase II [Oscillospiraceae bacterium]